MAKDIGILDYGAGNIGSIVAMLRRLGFASRVICDRKALADVDKLIIPGVGSFDYGMSRLSLLDVVDLIRDRVNNNTLQVLGICLGMQLLFSNSEEGISEGLNLVPGQVKRILSKDKSIKVPHMGWNYVSLRDTSLLFSDIEKPHKFYFVHSYHCVPNDTSVITSTVNHGEMLVASISYRGIHGVQFHPEKSHQFGMALLANFAAG